MDSIIIMEVIGVGAILDAIVDVIVGLCLCYYGFYYYY
jgi:hypothetical protein